MKQVDSNTWASSLSIEDTVYIYATLPEAQIKLEELEANNPNETTYMIESYPDGTEI